MDLKLSEAITRVRLALRDTAEKSAVRRLSVYDDRIPCKAGCSGCCTRLVNVSVAEALLIFEHLEKSGDWPRVAVECRKQFQAVRISNHISWFLQGRDCPVLDPETRRCSAYSTRPAACSTHFVTSDPRLCDASHSGSGRYRAEDFEDLFAKFRLKLGESVESYGVMMVTLPIQQALLLAERINLQSGLTVEKTLSLFLNEL